nr:MAG TPA: hypothetical protein [Caudoviricetes sp.]
MNTQQIFMRLDGVIGTRVTPSNQQDTTSISLAKGMEVVLSFSIFSGDTADSLIPGSTLAEYAAWEFVLNDKFDPNPVELRSTSITINQANNSIDVYISDTNTVELSEWLGETDSKIIGFALEGTRTGKTKPDLILQSTMVIYNRRNSAGEPTENPDNYYTKTVLNAILSAGDEYEFSVDGETDWHSTQADGDKYMRSRNKEIAGDWSDALKIPAGTPGKAGTNGTSSYLYIAYASDAAGKGFSLIPSDSLPYRAEIVSETEITTPTAADFAGKWVRFVGQDGTAGAGFNTPITPVSDADAVTPETGKITPYIRQNGDNYELAGKKPDGETVVIGGSSGQSIIIDFATVSSVNEGDTTCSVILNSTSETVESVAYDFAAATTE